MSQNANADTLCLALRLQGKISQISIHIARRPFSADARADMAAQRLT
jgi:hypothetical protein